MTATKRHYVLIESLDPRVRINGYDTWLCPWSDFDATMTAPMEQLTAGEPWPLKLTVLEMTDAEYQTYCAEHEIELDE